jgi:Kef-type K+ transport system membrane component KefB
MKLKYYIFILLIIILILGSNTIFASGTEEGGSGNSMTSTLLWIAIILIAAKLSSLVEKFGQPPVLGELVVGVLLGNIALLGINTFEPIKTNQFLLFLSELGVIILLFQVGLESNISQMKKVGMRAFLVATVGVVCPFVLGTYIVGPWLFPGLSSNAYLFLGAALTATSVGITARVFKDLNKLKTPEAQIVLGAAVIDDVMGLIILAIVSAIATLGSVSLGIISIIFLKAILFLVGAIFIGQILASFFGKMLSKIHTGVGMKLVLALSFAFIFSYIAGKMGLAPIVGAFAAGLVLDPVHFKFFKKPKISEELDEKSKKMYGKEKEEINEIINQHSEKHVEDLIEPIGYFLVPIFFVMTGMGVNLETLFDPKVLTVALAITFVAIIGKYASGFFAGKVNKNIVGFGMVPRGEVGLIFASIGIGLGVINQQLFSVIIIMVIFTTLLTPPILTYLIKKSEGQQT